MSLAFPTRNEIKNAKRRERQEQAAREADERRAADAVVYAEKCERASAIVDAMDEYGALRGTFGPGVRDDRDARRTYLISLLAAELKEVQ